MEIKPQQNNNKPKYPALVKAAAATAVTAAALAASSVGAVKYSTSFKDSVSAKQVPANNTGNRCFNFIGFDSST
ncbi:MAG: hypothetical protein IKT79_06260 [Akkermansia sp.]|nr:hypothetical protein [Akkermansia sp.]